MLDSYRSMSPENQPYISRARKIRAQAFRTGLGIMAGAILSWSRRGIKKMKCWHIQRRAEQQLRGLSNIVLKDMGMSRSDIPWRVRESLPCS